MPQVIQNSLIILLAGWMAIDNGSGGQILNYWPVTIGFVMGLITGDMQSAMVIAGTLQLMSLGVAALDGASVPEYGLATIVAIYIASQTGAKPGTAIAVGLPVGMLTLQLDVIVKIVNNYFSVLSQKFLHAKRFKAMQMSYLASIFVWTLKYVIPVSVVVLFGAPVVKSILDVIPKWFTDGLTIAGGMLPVVGVGMLMHFMPAIKYLSFIILGFVLSAYLEVPILGIALLGVAAAYGLYLVGVHNTRTIATVNTGEDGDDYDE